MRRIPQYRGFTLFELIIVMAIIAAMIAVVAPYASRSNENLEFENQAKEIADTLQYALSISEKNKTLVRFILNTQEKTFSLEMADKDGLFHPLPTSLGQQRYLNSKCVLVDIEGFTREGYCYYLNFDATQNWPVAYFTIAGEEFKKTINIQSQHVSLNNKDD